ncbi:MAG: hypothetical protein R8P61_00790 [Bacteroidia bacterium]|nr:hypothetical protein [Bacteroidia bacterium]
MKHLLLLLSGILINSVSVFSQRNCDVFLTAGDSCSYKACDYLEKAPSFFQLRKEFHDIYDKALEICPEYSDAYRGKSVAYLKTGDFINWKILMDKAVELNPIEHLGYRAWCRFQFFRDYQGAIEDIETLESLSRTDIAYSQNGMYHLKVAKALCYKSLNKRKIAIQILEDHLANYQGAPDLYDYLHLGVLYLEEENFGKALATFEKQSQEYNCAENAYYKAMAYQGLTQTQKTQESLKLAHELYLNHKTMYDPYTHQVDKIFLADIEAELEKSKN